MKLPPKRHKPHAKLGLFEAHRKFVRSHQCSIPGCLGSPIEFAHMRNAANSGMGKKPADWFGISLCARHHRLAHEKGHATMAKAEGLSLEKLFDLAAEFAAKSPDRAMKEAMKDAHQELAYDAR